MPCCVCKEPSTSQCPNCKVPYCSKNCQRIDWKRGHKNKCKELTKELQRGYGYVEPTTKEKEAPPVVVIPDKMKPTVDMKEPTKKAPKAVDEAPSGGESAQSVSRIFRPAINLYTSRAVATQSVKRVGQSAMVRARSALCAVFRLQQRRPKCSCDSNGAWPKAIKRRNAALAVRMSTDFMDSK